GYKGTVTDIVLLSFADCHRTTFGKFLSQGVWNINYAWRGIKKFVVRIIIENSSSDTPLFAIYDDTISEKTKPSSKAENTIQEASFHRSHLKKKQVYGHQLLTTMLSNGKKVLPFFIERYRKGEKSKIKMVCDIVTELPSPKGKAYGLCDSWFTTKDVINAHFKKGYHLIGALKTNRVIYPKGINIQVKDFAQYIEKNDVCIVTVNNSKYWVYRYEGNLNGIDNAVVLFCWPENAFKKAGSLHAFLCTDIDLSTKTILEYYSKRWPIEIFFKQTKNNLGLNSYQVRSTQSIDRMLVLISLTYIFCTIQENAKNSFSRGIAISRNNVKKDHIKWIYECAKNNIPIENVLKTMKIA
ncbi:transposase, partial [Clostridium sp. SHJSY1]|uniref:IS701 family transposase n=1 Tax=Clostridium sp. SHJSY1 TaxID=2942483 RepID=UPI0028770F96